MGGETCRMVVQHRRFFIDREAMKMDAGKDILWIRGTFRDYWEF
jgi:hypothetical protein